MNLRHLCLGVVGPALLLAASGCAGGTGKPVKVEGTVTLDGNALDGAMVQFYPEDGGGHAASGTTGTDGSFRLTTWSNGDGALPGNYKIVITKKDDAVPTVGNANGDDPKFKTDMMKKFSLEQSKKAPPKKPSLPANYMDATKTPLKQVVPPPDGGPIKLELRSSGA